MVVEAGVAQVGHSGSLDNETLLIETVRHEENLINSRLTWMLTFQGFLFAAESLAANHAAILRVVPWVGMAVASLSFLGVAAAYGTIDVKRRELAGAKYGGTSWRKVFGRTNSLGIPIAVVAAWVALAASAP
jgi:hypothetical protein